MKIQTKLIGVFLFTSALPLAYAAEFEDFANVTRVSPQVEQVNRPRQECKTEYVPVERSQGRGVGGSILGGVAGALLGNQIGGGNGRTAATAAGAIAGAVVGDRLENDGSGTTIGEQPVRQCRTIDQWETRRNGYAVTYEYRGRTYTSVMPDEPGDRIKVRVSVTPVADYTGSVVSTPSRRSSRYVRD